MRISMLKIEGLSKEYSNGTKALDDIDLEVGPGMFGLLGPNGAGKSSLMRTIGTLQKPDKGVIHFKGINVMEDPEKLRECLGYLPQSYGFYPKMKAEELLDMLADLKGVNRKKERKELTDYLLHRVNLWEHRKGKIADFSGGMKQRIGIAQALIGNPELIIVDEPTAGLDPGERNRFNNILSEISENIVVILSTHIVDDVKDLCTDAAIMNKGKILKKGNPFKMMEELEGKIWAKVVHKSDEKTYREKFDLISSRLFAGQLVLHIYSESDPGDGFKPADATLEDYYFRTIN